MKRNIFIVLTVLALILGLAACSGDKTEAKLPPEEKAAPTISAILITGAGEAEKGTFNGLAWSGVEQAAVTGGGVAKLMESTDDASRQQNLLKALEEQPDLILGAGYTMEDVIRDAAKDHPDQKFALIDGTVHMANVASVTFRDNESAFLAGVAAAMTSQTKTVGFIGGEASIVMDRFQYGYQAGVKAIDPSIRVLVNETGSFDDEARGRECVLSQIQGGADVIFHAAGASGIGVIEAAGEHGIRVIGVDQDQSALSPQTVLCSVVKHVDQAAADVIQSLVNDEFEDGVISYGLKEDGVGISDNAGNLTDEVKVKLDEFRNKIVDGSLKVPYDRDGFDTFEVPVA